MIDRQVVDPPFGFGFRIDIGICATDEPVDGRRVPRAPEAPEVLACRGWTCMSDTVGREMTAQRLGDAVARLPIVDVEGIAIQRCDLWRARRTRCHRFGIDDPFDRRERVLAYPFIEGADVQLDDGLVWNDIFLGTGLERTHRDHRGIGGGDFTETMVCSRRTIAAAMTTGSTLACGIEP